MLRHFPRFVLPSLSSLVAGLTSSYAQSTFEYTGDAFLDNSWSNSDNWEMGGQPTMSFPNDEANVLVPGSISSGTVEIGQQIDLTNFNILAPVSFNVDLDGNELNVKGQLNGTGGTKRFHGGGVLSVKDLLTNSLSLTDTTLTLDGESQGVLTGGGLSLFDSATLDLSGTLTLRGNQTGIFGSPQSKISGNGILNKLVGTQTSHIGSRLSSSLREIRVDTGTLQIDGGGVLPSMFSVYDSATVRIASTMSGTTFFHLTDEGSVTFSETPAFSGIIGSSGLDTFGGGVYTTAGFSGGTFNLNQEAPFYFAGGNQDLSKESRNTGHFNWTGGILGNFFNDPGGKLTIDSSGATSGKRLADILSNSGEIKINQAFVIAPRGALLNSQEGTLIFDNGLSAEGQGIDQGKIINSGLITDSNLTDTVADIVIQAPIESTGTISAKARQLCFSGGGTLSGTVTSSDQGSTSFTQQTNPLTLNQTHFTTTENGQSTYLGKGTISVIGKLTSEGPSDSSFPGVNFYDSDLNLTDGSELAFSPNYPLVVGFDAANSLTTVRPKGSATNSGNITMKSAQLLGPSDFTNRGDITIRNFSISASPSQGNPTPSGRIRNFGNLTFNKNGKITLHENGELRNDTGGIVKFSDSGTIVGANGLFLNDGTLQVEGHDTGNETLIRIESKFDMTTPAANVTVSGDNSRLLFSGESNFLRGNMSCSTSANLLGSGQIGDNFFFNFTKGGSAKLNGSFQINGQLNLMGDGNMELIGGTLKPRETTFFNIGEGAQFLISDGFLGEPGIPSTIITNGTVTQTGGTVSSKLTNAETYKLQSGRVSGPEFSNEGTLEWTGGAIASPVFENSGSMLLDGIGLGFSEALLFRNLGAAILKSTLSFRAGSNIFVEPGATITSEDGASLSAANSDITFQRGSDVTFYWIDAPPSTATLTSKNLTSKGKVTIDGGDCQVSATNYQHSDSQWNVTQASRVFIQMQNIDQGAYQALHIDGFFQQNDIGNPDDFTSVRDCSGSGTLALNLEQLGHLGIGFQADYRSLLPPPPTEDQSGKDLQLNLTGHLRQAGSATTAALLSNGNNSRFVVSRTAEIDGILSLHIDPLNPPLPGQVFTILQASSISGDFDHVQLVNAPAGASVTHEIIGGSLNVTFAGASLGYDDWLDTFFTTEEQNNPSLTASDADPDLDGITNLFEYITGSSPLEKDPVFAPKFSLETLPDTETSIPVFEIPTVAGRGGFLLGINSTPELAPGPEDRNLEVQVTNENNLLVIRGLSAATADENFYRLTASLLTGD